MNSMAEAMLLYGDRKWNALRMSEADPGKISVVMFAKWRRLTRLLVLPRFQMQVATSNYPEIHILGDRRT
jgi:hypothetical protein